MSELRVSSSGPLKGTVEVPGDKSISHRSVILSSIAQGDTLVKGILFGEDVLATRAAFQAMGVEIEEDEEKAEMLIHGRGPEALVSPKTALDLGNSGTSMRLLSGLLAGLPLEALLIGDQSLSQRDMRRVVEPLRAMGADIGCTGQGTAPIMIKGKTLEGIRYRLPMASAQLKSALLLAGLFGEGETWVAEPGPARDHTECMLSLFGVEVHREEGGREVWEDGIERDTKWIGVRGAAELRAPGELAVPGDISSAAFFMVAALIVPGSEVVIRNVGVNPTRTGIIDALSAMGADITVENRRSYGNEPVGDVRVRASALKGIEVKGELTLRSIDEIPVLGVAAAKASGTTAITDAGELRKKESDRIESMFKLLSGMGVKVRGLKDGLVIEGPAEFNGAAVESRLDHRIAMSAAVAGLAAKGEVVIRGAETIATSFPKFSSALTALSS